MDTGNLVDEVRFYLRQCWRLKRLGRDPLALSNSEEATLWEHAQAAAMRLQRLSDLQPVPVPVERRRLVQTRRAALN